MKFRDLHIQTQREAPNNARTEGFAFLVRAGYLSRENSPTSLGKKALDHLRELSGDPSFLEMLSLPTLKSKEEIFFPLASGPVEYAHCENCSYTERLELAQFAKSSLPHENDLPLEKIHTPDCHTIEALAAFLDIPKEKTAKALMYARLADQKFVFVVVRGDMQLSEAKLKKHVGAVRPATAEEIERSGAVGGYASPVGLTDTLVVVDDLLPLSRNLVAGANEPGYHLSNTNYGRDYSAQVVEDLVQVKEGDACINCGHPLAFGTGLVLASNNEFLFPNILLALAESHHDERGLAIPYPAVPFTVYLMHIPGKQVDTGAKAAELYARLQEAGMPVLYDDREERAGVKFNDADLIGCPIRVTVGEKALREDSVEVKLRREGENHLVRIEELVERLASLLRYSSG
jgi:prolyl-tRNA synthetase